MGKKGNMGKAGVITRSFPKEELVGKYIASKGCKNLFS